MDIYRFLINEHALHISISNTNNEKSPSTWQCFFKRKVHEWMSDWTDWKTGWMNEIIWTNSRTFLILWRWLQYPFAHSFICLIAPSVYLTIYIHTKHLYVYLAPQFYGIVSTSSAAEIDTYIVHFFVAAVLQCGGGSVFMFFFSFDSWLLYAYGIKFIASEIRTVWSHIENIN